MKHQINQREIKMKQRKFNRHEVGRILDTKKRHLFFQLGSQIQSIKTRQFGFLFNSNDAHEAALWALDKTKWTSIRHAKALLKVGHVI